MSLNLSNLTPVAQKNLSAISSKITAQKKIIEKERAVLESKGDTYICNRARTTLASKKAKLEGFEEEYERKKKQLEAEIELQEKIIWDETHKETPTIIRANMEIESLTKEKNSLLNAAGVFTTEYPLTQAPRISEPEQTTEQSLDFALFMMDGRQDGQPIDPNPSYLSSVALGACMTAAQKKKGVKMP
jgi:peptidoglycan hydrolase CwlO-like protein